MVSIAVAHDDSNAITALAAWSARRRGLRVADVPKKTVSQEEQDYPKRIGRTIVTLRSMVGMSQATLAEQVDRSEAALSRWEGGKATPTAFDLRKIAEAVTRVLIEEPGASDLIQVLPSVLIYPPAIPSADPMVEAVLNEAERLISEAAKRPRPEPDAAALGRQVARSAVPEGLRRDRSRAPEAPGKRAQQPRRSARAR